MSSSPWWYGITLFPIVVLTALLSSVSGREFLLTAQSTDSATGLSVAWFLLNALSFWTGVLVAVVVLVCLLADIRALSGEETWSPSIVWGVAAVVHLGGVLFIELFVISVPTLSYYLYRRRECGGGS